MLGPLPRPGQYGLAAGRPEAWTWVEPFLCYSRLAARCRRGGQVSVLAGSRSAREPGLPVRPGPRPAAGPPGRAPGRGGRGRQCLAGVTVSLLGPGSGVVRVPAWQAQAQAGCQLGGAQAASDSDAVTGTGGPGQAAACQCATGSPAGASAVTVTVTRVTQLERLPGPETLPWPPQCTMRRVHRVERTEANVA